MQQMLDRANTEIKAFVYDNSATTAYQFAEHTVNSGTLDLYRMDLLY